MIPKTLWSPWSPWSPPCPSRKILKNPTNSSILLCRLMSCLHRLKSPWSNLSPCQMRSRTTTCDPLCSSLLPGRPDGHEWQLRHQWQPRRESPGRQLCSRSCWFKIDVQSELRRSTDLKQKEGRENHKMNNNEWSGLSKFAEEAVIWAERYFTPHSSQLREMSFRWRLSKNENEKQKPREDAATWETKYRSRKRWIHLQREESASVCCVSTLLWLLIGGIGPGFSTIIASLLFFEVKSQISR